MHTIISKISDKERSDLAMLFLITKRVQAAMLNALNFVFSKEVVETETTLCALRTIFPFTNLLPFHKLGVERFHSAYQSKEVSQSCQFSIGTDNSRKRKKKTLLERDLVKNVAHEINTPTGVCLTASSCIEHFTKNLEKHFVNNSMTKSNTRLSIEKIKEASRLIQLSLTKIEKTVDRLKDANSKVTLSKKGFQLKTQKYISVETDLSAQFLLENVLKIYRETSMTASQLNAPGNPIQVKTCFEDSDLVIVYTDTENEISESRLTTFFHPLFTNKKGESFCLAGNYIVSSQSSPKLDTLIKIENSKESGCRFYIRFLARKHNEEL